MNHWAELLEVGTIFAHVALWKHPINVAKVRTGSKR
jgi:hypothetical protein